MVFFKNLEENTSLEIVYLFQNEFSSQFYLRFFKSLSMNKRIKVLHLSHKICDELEFVKFIIYMMEFVSACNSLIEIDMGNIQISNMSWIDNMRYNSTCVRTIEEALISNTSLKIISDHRGILFKCFPNFYNVFEHNSTLMEYRCYGCYEDQNLQLMLKRNQIMRKQIVNVICSFILLVPAVKDVTIKIGKILWDSRFYLPEWGY